MTHTDHLVWIVIGLLVMIGFGVWRVIRHTGFIAYQVARMSVPDEAQEQAELDEDIYGNGNPVGFHTGKGAS